MSRSIRMEVPQVEACIAALRRVEQAMSTSLNTVSHTRARLLWAWEGPGSEVFFDDFNRLFYRLRALLDEFADLIRALERERDEWVRASQTLEGSLLPLGFGTFDIVLDKILDKSTSPPWESWEDLMNRICGADAKCRELWKRPPQNAAQLALMIHYLPADFPMALMPLGNGEYLLLLKGTGPGGHNFGSAFESQFSHNNNYQLNVLDFLSILPPGAVLHIAGHSQGGMVAQNLAVDPRLKDRGIRVKSVTTFGSPDTLQRANPDTKYTMFQQWADPVGYIDEGIELISRIKNPSISTVVLTQALLSDVESQAEVHRLHSSLKFHSYSIPEIQAQLSKKIPGTDQYKYQLPFSGSGEAWSQGAILGQTRIRTLAAEGWQEMGVEFAEGVQEMVRELDEGFREIQEAPLLKKPLEAAEMAIEFAREDVETLVEATPGFAKFITGVGKAIVEGTYQRLTWE